MYKIKKAPVANFLLEIHEKCFLNEQYFCLKMQFLKPAALLFRGFYSGLKRSATLKNTQSMRHIESSCC